MALEHIDDLEELMEKWDKRIRALEEVEELKPKVCWCARVEEINVPDKVRRGYRMCLDRSDLFPYRRLLGWSMSL